MPWLVLGIPRLHYTIATLNVTSKTGAGKYALEVVDRRWHPVVKSALSVRRDPSAPLSTSPESLREDAVELGAFLIQSAHTIVT